MARAIVDLTGNPSPVSQSKTTALFETCDPFVSCFSANRLATTQLGQPAFAPQIFLNEFPPLLFVTVSFPRHSALKVSPMRRGESVPMR
jgi:hypothetical protein